MRLLILSSFYPPARSGGYDQLCWDVVQELKSRGHPVAVLTSRTESEQRLPKEPSVYRQLYLDSDLHYYRPINALWKAKGQQMANQAAFKKLLLAYKPDIVFVWGMWAISRNFVAYVEELVPDRLVYYLAGHWPIRENPHTQYWNKPANRWVLRLPKKLLSIAAKARGITENEPRLSFRHSICVSYALRDALIKSGLPIYSAQVIHNGIKIDDFFRGERGPSVQGKRRQLALLYAGQLASHKGVHTLIKALDLLKSSGEIENIHLTLFGKGHPSYIESLKQLILNRGLSGHTQLSGYISRTEMPATLQKYDVLILPSLYDEPLARIVQEAMAAGLAVIGTSTGGTIEILHDGINGLTFPPGDAASLAAKIMLFKENPDLLSRLAAAGQQTVLKDFSLDRMVNSIEAYLQGRIQLSPQHRVHRPSGSVSVG